MIGNVDAEARNTALMAWYGAERRDLPWRHTVGDPYAVLVSEAMLQQTQVERVVPKYLEFMDAWPDIASLAEADTRELLRVWSGLGYNSRALRLRDAAGEVVEHGWPTTAKGLRVLPGVGPYTSAAIASMAFDQEVPAVDTNLRRILGRWLGEPLTGRDLDAAASDAVGSPAGDWNQAMMDLGSAICRPKPRCESCPVAAWCADPDVYEPPQRQPAFNGSVRQLRGALVRAHLNNEDLLQTGRALDFSEEQIDQTISKLADEGLIDTGP